MLDKNKAADVFGKIKKYSSADEVEALIYGGHSALTRFANNTIHQNVAEENYVVSVRTAFDGRTARATTNKLDDESLKRVVAASEKLAKVQHSDPDLLPMPGAGACLSPWVDLEGIGESMTTKADVDPIVQKAGLLQMAAAYLGGKAPRTPLAAPLYADLSGLPPLLIQVGTAETLLDDASRLAERARKAGVTVSYEPWERMIHVWHLFAPMLDEGQQAIDRIGEFVRKQAA